MIAESRRVLLSITALYVSSEIIGLCLPVRGLTACEWAPRTVLVQVLHDLAKRLLRLLVQVADRNTRSKHGIVGVRRRLVRRRLCREVVKLHGGNTLVDAINHLARDLDGVDIVHVQAIAQFCHTGSDLVEPDLLLASVCG